MANGTVTSSIHKITRNGFLAAAAVALLTLVLFLPALRNGFVNWDDDEYIYENPFIRAINPSFLTWAFFRFACSNWHPLTWLSHAADYALWGLDPRGHHLTSIIIHALNTFLVAVLSLKLLAAARKRSGAFRPETDAQAITAAAITALLFGMHPIHTESVAWISERKDVLSAFFYLSSILAYVGYAEQSRQKNGTGLHAMFFNSSYAGSLALFVLAAMSKPMAVSLPVALLILDWHPYDRLNGPKDLARLFVEKAPFLLVALAAGALTVMAQSGEAIVSFDVVPLATRLLVAFKSVFSYLKNMAFPYGLVPIYPYPRRVSLLSVEYLVPLAVVTALTAACIVLRKKRPALLAAWSFYIATLLPVIGIIQVAGQSMADRYAYLPSLGPFLLAGTGAAFLSGRMRKQWPLLVPGLLLLGFFAAMTRSQIAVWADGETLWSHEIKYEPAYSPGYALRAGYYLASGRYEEAQRDAEHALELSPKSPFPCYYLGMIARARGFPQDALVDLTLAVQNSAYPDFRFYRERAVTFAELGMYKDALNDLTEVLRMQPSSPDIYHSRGIILDRLGDYEAAIADFSEAIRISPAPDRSYYRDRANVYVKTGRFAEAAEDAGKAEEGPGK